jgi:hypothetical protein
LRSHGLDGWWLATAVVVCGLTKSGTRGGDHRGGDDQRWRYSSITFQTLDTNGYPLRAPNPQCADGFAFFQEGTCNLRKHHSEFTYTHARTMSLQLFVCFIVLTEYYSFQISKPVACCYWWCSYQSVHALHIFANRPADSLGVVGSGPVGPTVGTYSQPLLLFFRHADTYSQLPESDRCQRKQILVCYY